MAAPGRCPVAQAFPTTTHTNRTPTRRGVRRASPPQVVAAYNADPRVHGILVQLPLPKHISEKRILDAISIDKDVDGFHPLNIGCLAMRGRDPLFVPCTPKVRAGGGAVALDKRQWRRGGRGAGAGAERKERRR